MQDWPPITHIPHTALGALCWAQSYKGPWAGLLPLLSMSVQLPIFIANVSAADPLGLPEAYPSWNASIGTRPDACPVGVCYDTATRSRFWGMLTLSYHLDLVLKDVLPAL